MNHIDEQILAIQGEMKRLNEEREQTSQEIKHLHQLLRPLLADLNQLLEYDARLAHDILARENAINRLKRHDGGRITCVIWSVPEGSLT